MMNRNKLNAKSEKELLLKAIESDERFKKVFATIVSVCFGLVVYSICIAFGLTLAKEPYNYDQLIIVGSAIVAVIFMPICWKVIRGII